MKIFEDGSKVNFVDKNNVFVGYSLEQSCCERADWFLDDKEITDKYIERQEGENVDVKGYVFDINYYKELGNAMLYDGNMVIFRLVKDDKEKFLHLFNCHNGYYSHGFEAKIGNKKWKEGYL